MRWFLAGLVVAALSSAASDGRANGRFPAANQLVLGPDRLVVRSTFGLLVGDLPAGPLSWVCEAGIGLPDDQDPPLAVVAGGRVVLAPFEGLRRSDEAGCAFTGATGFDPAERLIDVAVERADAARAVAVAWHPASRQTRVYGTLDAGASWQVRGTLPETDGIPTTLDLAPSQPGRLAVAGSFAAQGKLLGYVSVSDDSGVTWRRSEVALEGASGLFLSAFDPQESGRLYARTSGGNASDRLLASTDAGVTFAELTRVDGAMLGFALSPDGGQVAVGGPLAGVRVAARGSLAFAPVRTSATSCLAWGMEGLYACGSGLGGDFAVGRSADAGATWQPVLARLADLGAPGGRCGAATSVATVCGPLWPAQQQALAAIGSGGGGASGAGASGASGAAGSGGSTASVGGAGGAGAGAPGGQAGGSAVAGRGGSSGVAIPDGDRGSCGAVRGQTGAGRAGVALVVLAAGLGARRRRAVVAVSR